MRRILHALCGACMAGTLSYAIADVFTRWYGPRFIRSDSDINDAYIGCLVFMATSVAIGALFGYRHGRVENVPPGS